MTGEQLSVFAPPPPRPARGTARWRVLDHLELWRGEWVPGHELTWPAVGGSEGLRRVRELRADGWPIEMRKGPRATRFYRLP